MKKSSHCLRPSSLQHQVKPVLVHEQIYALASAHYMSSASTTHRRSHSIATLSHRKNGIPGTSTNSHTASIATKSRNSAFTMSSILPFTSGYRRVDAKDESGGRISFRWKKFAIAAVVLIGLVWLFGPRERRDSVIDAIKSPCE